MIALTILGLVASTLLFRAKGLLDQFQAKQSLKQLMLDLRFTQQVSESYQIDIDCVLAYEPGSLVLKRTSDAVLPNAYQLKQEKRYRFKQVADAAFNQKTFTIIQGGKVLKEETFPLSISKQERYELSLKDLTLKRLSADKTNFSWVLDKLNF